jgi:MFS family permease
VRASPARTLVTGFFALDGFLFANWVVSVPEVKAHVHASAGSLGLALLGISVGALLTMTITGRLCARVGSGRVLVASATLMSIVIMLPARAASVAVLGAVLFVFGAAFGGLNVAGNSSAVDIIRELGRPIMPSFHAAFSLGGLLGAVVGGVIASQLRTVWQLTTVGVFGLVVTACLGALLLRSAVGGGAPAGVAQPIPNALSRVSG